MKKMKKVGKLIAVAASLLVAGTIGFSTAAPALVSAAAPQNFVSQYRSDAASAADA